MDLIPTGAHLHEHVVAKPTSNDGVVHHRLVRLFLEVRLPTFVELRRGPGFKLLEFFLGRPDLHSGVDTVGSERPGSLKCPLLIYTYKPVRYMPIVLG